MLPQRRAQHTGPRLELRAFSWGSGDAYSCPDDSQQRGYEIPTSMFSETKASDAKKKNDGRLNIGALIIRIGCWGTFYHDYKKEPPKSYR